MSAALASLRKLIFGETWTVPVGVAATLITALLTRAAVPGRVWTHAGGFLVAALAAATLCAALVNDR